MDNASKFGTLMLVQKPIMVPYQKGYKFSMQLGRYLVTVEPDIKTKNCCGLTNFEEIPLPDDKVFNNYIHYYPYLLGITLGAINISSIKTFKDKHGHEELNRKHKLKSKKNKILSIEYLDTFSKPNNEQAIPKGALLDLESNRNFPYNHRDIYEEQKSGLDDRYQSNQAINPRKPKDSQYASTDIRTSIDANFTLSRRTNNLFDERISITHRAQGNTARDNTQSISNNETLPQNVQMQPRGLLVDPEMYQASGPKNSPSSLDRTEDLSKKNINIENSEGQELRHQNHLKNHQVINHVGIRGNILLLIH
jgi:hypothetical protein